jgi:hypothetical protein
MIKKSANRTPLILHDSLEEEKREREREWERRRASKDAYNLLATIRELHACDMFQFEKIKFEVNGEEKEEEKSL